MHERVARRTTAVSVLRWTARAWSAGSVLMVLAFMIGERSYPSNASEWLGFLFFPLGICVGMIVAWWREGLGGIVTVASLGLFYLVRLFVSGALPPGWGWLVFAAPGFLFLLAWLLSRRTN